MIIKRKQKKLFSNLIFYVSLLFMLTLSLYNLELYKRQKIVTRQILGVNEEIGKSKEIEYWEKINKLYPSYYPALERLLELYEQASDQLGIEYCLGRIKEVNPNSKRVSK